MKKVILTLGLTLFTTVALFAQEKEQPKQIIAVKGQCEMCKKRIEKAALDVKGVRSVDWSVADQQLTVYLNPKKTSGKEVQEAIAKVGHDTALIKATDEAYNNLHSCCKYER
ncbi:heavy-metal-associated domain-containing protein [Myroides sp. WP-1]|uniref:heavy-metal-associated domain-containing protein n=1 Tax=Myroides sp. WP-1 TaxID=2759944 RepID=UPI0015FADB14|nr:heavy metal-associated domain-containing protein [Myroides sp. WP-1]MBB1138709.1 heavy-metal-associated domain-containing protein [Myroides sp. WP-1]